MSKRLNIKTGDRYGRLTIVSEAPKSERQYKWKREFLCKCDCGNYRRVRLENLVSGHTKSCGCYIRDFNKDNKIKHGHYGSRLYKIWQGIKKRCLQRNSKDYRDYGGRGIKICDEWMEFEPFYEWAINNGYQQDLTIERIDVNGNYEPSNCTWIPKKEQGRNTRRTKIICYKGEQKTLREWAVCLGLTYNVLQLRLSRGWSIEEAFTIPLWVRRSKRCSNGN